MPTMSWGRGIRRIESLNMRAKLETRVTAVNAKFSFQGKTRLVGVDVRSVPLWMFFLKHS